MTGVSPPSFIRGAVHQMGHPPNQTYRLYDNTTTQLDAIANGYHQLAIKLIIRLVNGDTRHLG